MFIGGFQKLEFITGDLKVHVHVRAVNMCGETWDSTNFSSLGECKVLYKLEAKAKVELYVASIEVLP